MAAARTMSMSFVKRGEKRPVGGIFAGDDDELSGATKKKPLVRLQYTTEERIEILKAEGKDPEKEMVELQKRIIEAIPKDTASLYAFEVDWATATQVHRPFLLLSLLCFISFLFHVCRWLCTCLGST